MVARVALELITASLTQSHAGVWGCCLRRKALYTSRKVEEEVHTGSVALRKPNNAVMEEVGVHGAWHSLSSSAHRRQQRKRVGWGCTFIYGDSGYRDSGDGS